MICGSCKQQHATVAEVRSCYASVPSLNRSESALWQGQESMPLSMTPGFNPETPGREYDARVAASDLPPVRQSGRYQPILARDWPHLQEGYYAVPSLTGKNDLDFFRVDMPSKGKWAGRVFLNRIVGGSMDGLRAPYATRRKWLDHLDGYKAVLEAQKRFGQEIGKCGRCGRPLTDDASRALGIGPVCLEKPF